jgi:hypothetical protein
MKYIIFAIMAASMLLPAYADTTETIGTVRGLSGSIMVMTNGKQYPTYGVYAADKNRISKTLVMMDNGDVEKLIVVLQQAIAEK